MKLTTPAHANENIRQRAFELLSDFYAGKKNYTTLDGRGGKCLSIRASIRWRLLSKDRGGALGVNNQ